MKVNLTTTLKNKNENNIITNKVIGEIKKDKILFEIDKDKYILKKESPKKVILNRNNDIIESTMYFEKNKNTNATYTMKKEEYNIEIEIKTIYLNITENKIDIHYQVIDSKDIYEYCIEMSEI